LPRFISTGRHPLRVYAVLELSIGLMGLLVPLVLPFLDQLYAASAGASAAGIPGRAGIAVFCLLPPTLLMGATLPAIARWVQATPRGVSRLGFFYGGNTAGAVIGSLLAGFYLLRVYDMSVATYVAAAINLLVAAGAFVKARKIPARENREASSTYAEEASAPVARRQPILFAVYLSIGLSGLCALGAEVIWTRLLALLLGGTVYTFSLILAVFLMGLGLGSSAGAFVARRFFRPGLALGFCQLLLILGLAWSASVISASLPYWPVDTSLSADPWINFQFDFVRCVWAILFPACLWGASFPLALAAAADANQDPGRLVGRVYAANTVGAIIGAVGFSVLGIAWLGTQAAQEVLIGLSACSALVMFSQSAFSATHPAGERIFRPVVGLLMAVTIVLACSLAARVPKIPWGVIAYGRHLPKWSKEIREGRSKVLYVGEGMNSSVAVTELSTGVRNFHVSGKVEASSETQDMRLQLMLGHIPALLHPKPRSVLIVGCGAGVTAGTFLLHPDIERVVICELEPLIPQVVAQYFGLQNNHVVGDKRVEIHYDDARHYILTTKEKFDIITSDPIHPWVKGAATLYSKEYFELCKQRLNPGGLITQWVPLYESSSEVVKSEVATFFAAFPLGVIWGNTSQGAGYDVVMMGGLEPLKVNVDDLQARFDRKDYWPIGSALSPLGFGTAVSLLGTYAGRASDLTAWTKDAAINRDRNLRLQYLAGLGLNEFESGEIYRDLLKHRRYPSDIFTASDERKRLLMLELKTANEPPETEIETPGGDSGP
jgi:spermidine synthase